MRSLLRKLVSLTKPLAWRIAEAYDLKVNRPLHAYGEHELIFEDYDNARHNVPKSVYFNTRSGCIVIGRSTVFGEDVKVLTGKHANIREARRLGVPLHHVPPEGRDIVIGSGCYIGSNSVIIGPVKIGDYAVVGAGSVVTRDVAAYCFVAGVPAKLIARLDGDQDAGGRLGA